MSLRAHLLCGALAIAALSPPVLAAAQPARGGGAPAAAGQQAPPPAAAELAPVAADTRLADAAARQDAKTVTTLLKDRSKVDVNAFGRDGSTALEEAVRYDDLAMAKALVDAGAEVKRPNRFGLSPLILAAQGGAVQMMALLLDHGANANAVDTAGEPVLMAASRDGSAKAVALLLDHGAQVDAKDAAFGQTALMIAVRENHPELVELLIKRGADVNARDRVGPAPKPRMPGEGGGSHGEGIVRSGIPPQGARPAQPGGMTPLLYAARDGRTDCATLLLAAGAKIELADANAMTPLLMALLNAQMPTAQLLLDHGAAVNVHDYWGRTPLYAAIEVRDREVNAPNKKDNGVDRPAALQLAKALLDKGADPNARVKEYAPDRRFIMNLGSLAWVNFTGQTAFIHAALADDVDGMKLLLQYKADPNITTFGGTTALAAASGVNWVFNQTWTEPGRQLEAVKFLVDLGQDVNGVNDMGLAPLHGAANRGSNDVIEYLVSKGARLEAKDKVGRTPLVWAGGVFLATNAPEPRPATEALIKDLLARGPAGQGDRAKVADAPGGGKPDGRKDAARSRF
ncbi:MAG TPA: ankyrin repeat domain-containing protein [Caulobacteraceae bacterium]|jgi:ankyrin repeat protein